jgi:hypothetical protein
MLVTRIISMTRSDWSLNGREDDMEVVGGRAGSTSQVYAARRAR